MHLVHVHLRLPRHAQLPSGAREMMRAAIRTDDLVEHLAVHAGPARRLTLGFFLVADLLEEAETRAVHVSLRLSREVPALDGAQLLDAGVPLMELAFEQPSR
ncbi:hypothetical protein ABZ177_30615 [Streptomyces sp. NPDC006284]|uniref:hypothetical protein n=1 Tax=unclassified Streptomyces TaxID=2593676 RepID=UPI0033B87A22